ncbi:uncharacterized protein LOC127850746 [Dreissena polymorpha]|uniref:Uncharacterized protein n=1 Tax=Dreissena polymorpha TaxID=45954 RepID=A0A9D4HUC0_DREPO|nr:uncharacterized protein LOC127850746 [Dreissena polymorpha]KAH3733327.1 hypothetical protein DPMN_039753 [Dreissena polymorpha]
MTASSTSKYPERFGYDSSSHAVSPVITLVILVAGVAGGLIIVISFILFCKYCVKRKNSLTRSQGTDCERFSDRRFKPFQRYETVNSDMFSEPSTGSMDGIPVSPRRLFETKSHEKIPDIDEGNESVTLKSDYEKAYCETTIDPEARDPTLQDSDSDSSSEKPEAREPSGRRVSFQLDSQPPCPTGYLRKGRRYTDGDFHYLKKARIHKNVPRQYSLGTPLQKEQSREVTHSPLASTAHYHSPQHSKRAPDSFPAIYTHTHLGESPSALVEDSDDPTARLVDVEVHDQTLLSDLNTVCFVNETGAYGYSYGHSSRRSSRVKDIQPTSYSMDGVSPIDARPYRDKRRVKSYDDVLYYDYDALKITEFSRGPFFNSEFDPIMEVDNLGSSKVRYNDRGSLEVLNDDKLDIYEDLEFENNIIPDESDADTETTINGTHKFREIWNLRATFEEEEECSDTLRMEDMASPEESSPERPPAGASCFPTYHHKNGVGASRDGNHGNRGIQRAKQNGEGNCKNDCVDLQHIDPENSNLLHPNYENRRDDFRMVVNRRYQKRGSTSAENSFDSVETGDTTESSRHEVTTSFESTTDNTDSTNDSQTSRLRQMKADSGYKSMEAQPSSNGVKKTPGDDSEIEVLATDIIDTKNKCEVLEAVGGNDSVTVPRRGSLLEKRRGRTASKRRREYSKDRQVVRLNESIYEPETDSTRSDQPSGDSIEEPVTPNTKLSVFTRFFKSHKSRTKSLVRDFSIDEQSNNIFQEFIRYDPKYDARRCSNGGIESRRQRLQRKCTDPGPGIFFEDRKWLCPEMRSTSLGSDSSASSARKISSQDSIEEEVNEEEDIDAVVLSHKNKILEDQEVTSRADVTSICCVTTTNVSLHEIPIIKLPEGESVDVEV